MINSLSWYISIVQFIFKNNLVKLHTLPKLVGKFGINLVLIEPELMCKLYTVGKIIKLAFQCILQSWIWSSLEGVMINLLQLVQAWEFKRLLWLFNFIYLFCVKFINVLGKSIINNSGLVKAFKAPFDKPILGGLFQCFHLYF